LLKSRRHNGFGAQLVGAKRQVCSSPLEESSYAYLLDDDRYSLGKALFYFYVHAEKTYDLEEELNS